MRGIRFPIALKLTLGFAFVALLPMALLIAFAFRSLVQSHEEREWERRRDVLTKVSAEIELMVNQTKSQLGSMADDNEVREGIIPPLDMVLERQNALIQRSQFLLRASGLDFLDFIGSDGSIRASAEDPSKYNVQSGEERLLESLKGSPDASPIVRIRRRETEAGAIPALEVITPVIYRGGTEALVMGGHFLNKSFFSRLGVIGGQGVVILTDGNLVGLGSNLDPGNAESFFQYLSRLKPEDLNYPLDEKKSLENPSAVYNDYLLTGASLDRFFDPSTPVYLVIAFPVGDFKAFILDISKSLLFYSALAALLALIFGLIMARSISAPIRRLSQRALEFAETGKFRSFPARSGDEVSALVQSFHQMAEELEANTRRMIQAEKLATWRDVARKLAHEIKNPLFPIRLNVENMQRFYKSDLKSFDETFTESTDTILEEVEHLKRLADEFSSFARMPKPLLVPGDLNRAVKHVMEMFPSDDKITYICDLDEGIPEVLFDESQLRMALINLVKNGAESLDGKPGTVMVNTHNLPEERKVLIEVSDTGPGIPAEKLHAIFTPYYTTKEGGTGLGLAIVENVINDHGGKIWAQSQPGEGTTFFITLNTVEK